MTASSAPSRAPTTAVRQALDLDSAPTTALRGWTLALARLGWLVVTALAVGLLIVSVPLNFEYLRVPCVEADCAFRLTPDGLERLRAHGLSADFYAVGSLTLTLIFAGTCCAIAALLVWRSTERMALFAAFMLVMIGVKFWGTLDVLVAAQPGWFWALVVPDMAGGVAFYTFCFLFPDGRLTPRWTRPLVVLALATVVVTTFQPDWPEALEVAQVFGLLLGGIAAQISRYRSLSDLAQRQQTKWAVFGTTMALGGFVGLLLLLFARPSLQVDPLSSLAWQAAIYSVLLLIPLSLALAILRSRLWDIDGLINRALVYGALTASVVGFYVLVVGYLGAVFHTSGSLAISLLATGLVAVLFQPLRERLQRGVNRLLYGERDDPYAVITRLGQRLEATLAPEAVPPTIVQTVREALKLPYAAIALRDGEGNRIVAASGAPVVELLQIPLIYQTEVVGEMRLAPRAPGEAFGDADRRLLDDLARQAGVAAHAVHLTTELQRARERLVTAREEERRRLRRDLHDGLGPLLGSLTLKLDVADDLLEQDATAARALLHDLKRQTQTAIADIRRLVYALRPPALDELGLVAALREQAGHYEHAGLSITLDAPEQLPPLPAAVEVAAYRIAQEALTNVARHAQARHCAINLALDDEAETLRLEIRDDGRGLAPTRGQGVGLASMRERAEELGGRCEVVALPAGGTRARAWLPCPELARTRMPDHDPGALRSAAAGKE